MTEAAEALVSLISALAWPVAIITIAMIVRPKRRTNAADRISADYARWQIEQQRRVVEGGAMKPLMGLLPQ